jgi:hypothetical protein
MHEGAAYVAARKRSAAAERQVMVAPRVQGSVTRSAYCLMRKHTNSQKSGHCEGEDTCVHGVIAC